MLSFLWQCGISISNKIRIQFYPVNCSAVTSDNCRFSTFPILVSSKIFFYFKFSVCIFIFLQFCCLYACDPLGLGLKKITRESLREFPCFLLIHFAFYCLYTKHIALLSVRRKMYRKSTSINIALCWEETNIIWYTFDQYCVYDEIRWISFFKNKRMSRFVWCKFSFQTVQSHQKNKTKRKTIVKIVHFALFAGGKPGDLVWTKHQDQQSAFYALLLAFKDLIFPISSFL